VKPVAGPGGTIQFLYGSTQPSIVCAVLQVCDVELQPGEQVNSIHLGDTVRWTVEPAITGYGPTEVQHLIVKPMDVNLDTTLLVTTNRRTYSLRLRSHRTQFMPKVSFAYPDEALRKWDEIKLRDREERARATLPGSQEYLGNLDFDYAIDGAGSWKPVRVYNDGVKHHPDAPHNGTNRGPHAAGRAREGRVFPLGRQGRGNPGQLPRPVRPLHCRHPV
jgi:type IV secretion system protein VirB9